MTATRFPYNRALRAIRHPRSAYEVISLPRRLATYLRVPRTELEAWAHQLIEVDRLPSRLAENYEQRTKEPILRYSGGATIGVQNEVLYYLVRHLKPEVAVETGVAAGFSTSYLLQGLRDNARGRLYSVDLASTNAEGYISLDGARDGVHIPSEAGTGFVIPEELRDRWTLLSGPSSELLPPLLSKLGTIDLFWHDSDHSYQNMSWEFGSSWPHVRVGGALASDDITWNRAFADFGRSIGETPFRWMGRGLLVRRASPASG